MLIESVPTSAVRIPSPRLAPGWVRASFPLTWRQVGVAALSWLGTRVAYALVTYYAVLMTQASATTLPGSTARMPVGPRLLAHAWLRWDAALFYLPISQHGYHRPIDANFFPLYPWLVRLGATTLLAPHWLTVALLISNGAALAFWIGLAALARQQGLSWHATQAALALAGAYPFAFFLAAPYPEALFLALVVWSLLWARQGHWLWAAAAAFLAMLTRPTGVVLALALVGVLLEQRHTLRQRWQHIGSAVARLYLVACGLLLLDAVPLGYLAYAQFCQWRYHDPQAALHAQTTWFQHQPMPWWQALTLIGAHLAALPPWTYWQARVLLDATPLLLAAGGLAVLAARRAIALGDAVLVAGVLALCVALPVVGTLFDDPILSSGRYLLAAFPLVLALGQVATRHAWLHTWMVGGGWALQALLLAFYLRGGWVV